MHYAYLNGEILPYKECRLHISDLQFQRGYGVFDFFRCREGSILWLEDYTHRLFRSMELAGIEKPISQMEFQSNIMELQEKNGLENGAFKVIVTGGYSDTLDSVTGGPNFIVLNIPWKRPPAETFTQGVNLVSCEHLRPQPEIKTLDYFHTMQLRNRLIEYNAVDLLYHHSLISEASRANIFFVRGGEVFTPASKILHGITRKRVLSLFPEVRMEDIEFDRLFDFDEIFITSTSRDVTPVVSIDGRTVGKGTPGSVTREIQALFNKEV